MKKTVNLIALFILTIYCSVGIAEEIQPEKGCKGNPAVIDECFEIHGRLSPYNGTPSVRIWKIGTKRLFGVLPSENEILPNELKKYLSFDTNIYGDFLVCPFTKAEVGYMQDVCVESASNVVIEKHITGKEKPVMFRLKNGKK